MKKLVLYSTATINQTIARDGGLIKRGNQMKLPTITELSALIRAIKPTIMDDYRASDDDTLPCVDLTIGWTPVSGDWNYQTGDNSYTGGAYFHPVWGIVTIYRRSNSRELARDIREQLAEQSI